MSWFHQTKPQTMLLHYTDILKTVLDGTRAYQETCTDEMSVVNAHLDGLPGKFFVCVDEG